MAYFERIDASTVRPTPHTGGAWAEHEQHIAPAIGLLAHVVEVDRDARRDDGLPLARISCDILGTVPLEPCTHEVRVLRPGGRLVIVDFAPHDFEHMREAHQHRRLGFADSEISGWLVESGLTPSAPIALPPDNEGLTVTIWTAERRAQDRKTA